MKNCPKCGNELSDTSVYCSRCGSWQQTEQPRPQSTVDAPSQVNVPSRSYNPFYHKGPTTVNKVFLLLTCASVVTLIVFAILFTSLAANWSDEMYHKMVEAGFTFTPDEPQTGYLVFSFFAVYFWILSLSAAWVVPMTINYFKKSKEGMPTTLAYKICTLIFVNTVVDIIMLCCEKND